MKYFLPFLLLLFLAGCGKTITPADLGISPEKSPVPQNLNLDRQGAWAAVSITKLDAAARIKEAEARAKEAEADRAQAEAIRAPAPQLIIDEATELAIYKEIQRDKQFAEMAKQNADIAKAALNALQPKEDSKALELPAQPKSAVAEVIISTGDAVKKVLDTDAAKTGIIGAIIAGAAGDKTTVSGDGSSAGDLSSSITETVETTLSEVK